MLAANAHVHVGANRPAQFDGHLHQAAHAVAIQPRKRVVLKDLGVVICLEELAGVRHG